MIADMAQAAAAGAPAFHTGRRNYLRQALRAMLLLLADKPGLLGPKV